ncbi:MAG: hypothetical protein WCG60_00195 [bacterium]
MQSKFFLNRIFKYLDERFNLLQFISLSLILAGFIGVSTQLYLFNKISLLPIFLSTVALFLFLFRLRIFDEFKDYSHDIKHYPNRPISNGLVTLKELRLIFFPAIFLEIILALYLGKNYFYIFFYITFVFSTNV